jgi:3',5'-cyclic AMP phosphodiesterase CpdA
MRSSVKFLIARTFLMGFSLSALVATSTSLFAESWSFAVAGDDRTDIRQISVDPTGIHTEMLKKLLQAIVQQKPQFLLFTGDLVYGDSIRIATRIDGQFSAWKSLVKSEAPNLAILPVRGNHEINGDPNGIAWLAAFKPGLDANKVVYFPDQKGFSYTYSPPGHPETVIIALDQFMPATLHRVDLPSLEQALKQAKANGAKHIFVFAHEMAFTCGCHPDADNMAAFPIDRDKFLELLRTYGCEYFFAGHDHLYDWMEIKNWRWPADYALNQIVAGTAGAPFYPDKTYFGNHDGYDLTRIEHKQNTYGYLLVTINDEAKAGDKPVTVTFEAVNP